MANTNILEGFKCPKCGYEDHFVISATCEIDVTDDGTECRDGYTWEKDSACMCAECNYNGKISDFVVQS